MLNIYNQYVNFTNINTDSLIAYEKQIGGKTYNLQELLLHPDRNDIYIVMSYNVFYEAIEANLKCDSFINNLTECGNNIIKHISDIYPDLIALQESDFTFTSKIISTLPNGHYKLAATSGKFKAHILYNEMKFILIDIYGGYLCDDTGRPFIIALFQNITTAEQFIFISLHNCHGSSFGKLQLELTNQILLSKLLTHNIDRIIIAGDFNLDQSATENDYPLKIANFTTSIHTNGNKIKTACHSKNLTCKMPNKLSDFIFDTYDNFHYYDIYNKYWRASDHIAVITALPVITKNYIAPILLELYEPKWIANSCFAHSAIQLLKLITNKVNHIIYDDAFATKCNVTYGTQEDVALFINNFIHSLDDIQLINIFLSALKYRIKNEKLPTCGNQVSTISAPYYIIELSFTPSIQKSLILYKQTNTLTDSNKYKCSEHGLEDATESNSIVYTSNFILIQLMRYNNTLTKIENDVDVNNMIIIDNKKYNCVGIILHNGPYGGGHYVTILTPDGINWYLADDMNNKSIFKKGAQEYVNYEHIDIKEPIYASMIKTQCYMLLYKFESVATDVEEQLFYTSEVQFDDKEKEKNEESVIIIESTFNPFDKATQINEQDFYDKWLALYPNIKDFYLTNQLTDVLFPQNVYPKNAIEALGMIETLSQSDLIFMPEHVYNKDGKNFAIDFLDNNALAINGIYPTDVGYKSNKTGLHSQIKGVYHIYGVSDNIISQMNPHKELFTDNLHNQIIDKQFSAIMNHIITINKTDDAAIYLYGVPDHTHTDNDKCHIMKATINKWKLTYEATKKTNRKIYVIIDCGKTEATNIDMSKIVIAPYIPPPPIYSPEQIADNVVMLLILNKDKLLDKELIESKQSGNCMSAIGLTVDEINILTKLCKKHTTLNLAGLSLEKIKQLLTMPNVEIADFDDILEHIYLLSP